MKIKIATDFTTAPGPRYTSEGPFSGEEFRTKILYPALRSAIEAKDKLIVDLDGTSGYGTSFLEEIFGGLIRENGVSLAALRNTLSVVSNEEPDLLQDIDDYLRDAEDEHKSAS